MQDIASTHVCEGNPLQYITSSHMCEGNPVQDVASTRLCEGNPLQDVATTQLCEDNTLQGIVFGTLIGTFCFKLIFQSLPNPKPLVLLKTLKGNIYLARMTKLVRTNSENKDFQFLVTKLDAFLKITDGSEHAFYNQFNKIVSIKHVVVIYENNIPVGCGAIKHYADEVMEVKRMFVEIENRGKGIATLLLTELETWSKELNYKKCILETGKRQVEAIALYLKNNYIIIKSYGQYANVENSVCFEKELN